MRETLLVIDGRGQPESLVRVLEKAGFFCVYARGPLKVKVLLKEHPVALIVWKDNTGNADLSRDLAGAWKTYPQVPVIHLYAREPSPEAVSLGPQVYATLPVEAANEQLLPVIEQTLQSLKPAPPSELDVLGAAARRDTMTRAAKKSNPSPASPLAHTGVTSDERASLYDRTRASRRVSWADLWRIVRRLTRSRAQPESTRG